jgi:hypothetical protein
VRNVAWDAPIEKCLDVFEGVRGFVLCINSVNDLRHVVVRDFVHVLLPVEIFPESSVDLVLRLRTPPILREKKIEGLWNRNGWPAGPHFGFRGQRSSAGFLQTALGIRPEGDPAVSRFHDEGL